MWEWIIYPAGSVLLGYGVGWAAANAGDLLSEKRTFKAWAALAALSLGCALMYAEFASFAGNPLVAVRSLSYLLEGSAGAFAFVDVRNKLLTQRAQANRRKQFQDRA